MSFQNLQLKTPPPTIKKAHSPIYNPISPCSPTLNAINRLHHDETPKSWRDLPLILYDGSRQLNISDELSETTGDEHRKMDTAEPLFWSKSPSIPRNEDRFGDCEEEEDDDDGDIVFVGEARNAIRYPSKSKEPSPHSVYSREDDRHQNQIALSTRTSKHSGDVQQLKRHRSELHDDLSEDGDIAFVGRSYKQPRHELSSISDTDSREDTPLQAVPRSVQVMCKGCGSSREAEDSRLTTKGKGTGSNVLSAKVRGNITALLLNQEQSLYNQLKSDPLIGDWKDIAELVGAKREDFDRVRHSAKWLQDNLPRLVARGSF